MRKFFNVRYVIYAKRKNPQFFPRFTKQSTSKITRFLQLQCISLDNKD